MRFKHGMTAKRYAEAEESGKLTDAEVENGWHFCLELDGALVHRDTWQGVCQCYEQGTLGTDGSERKE